MAKTTRSTKPLPSALTVASSTQPSTRKPQAPTLKATPAEVDSAQPTASAPRPQPRRTPRKTSAKSSAPPAAEPSSQKLAVEQKAASPKAAQTVKVTFALLEPHARHVSVSGAFNGWATDATPLTRQNDGLWETSLALPPGRYEYKFVVDGQWLPDPTAQENVCNAHGTLNSVVEVRA